MSKLKLILLFALSASIIACSGKGSLDKIGGPSWIFDPYSVAKDKNEVAAVGISDPTQGGVKLQIAQAEADALGNLASQIKTTVDKIVTDSISKNENIKAGKDGKKDVVAKDETIEKKFSSVNSAIVDKLSLAGARRTDIWQDPKTGTLYVRMVMDIARVEDHFKKSARMYKALENEGVDKNTVKKLTDDILGAKLQNEVKTSQVDAK
ncbi:LPP20 family lipoprotein [Candidatus Deianiraea vastatrix]|uniref:LPP20 lipoprotein n=1 Tax=Candidatus Deianiraea vastatrix TaxID=2163644 RepID=A0A5B8XF71_9RICK|nr:LPP20 family lipoprotein [Candidatus Deianiraea vastatrix]QED23933.1 hypothetical protein Deia_01155 [Candidatus Deianiraea vastatrix]